MACLVSLKASVLIHCSWMMGKKNRGFKISAFVFHRGMKVIDERQRRKSTTWEWGL